jgi:uncharacterized protein YprB with RNaseH-like and TPR domain
MSLKTLDRFVEPQEESDRERCFLSIETTGLHGNPEIIAYMMYFGEKSARGRGILNEIDANKIKLRNSHQLSYFLRTSDTDERDLLLFLKDDLKTARDRQVKVLTYNGSRFLFPLLRLRAITHEVHEPLRGMCHIDIFSDLVRDNIFAENKGFSTICSLLNVGSAPLLDSPHIPELWRDCKAGNVEVREKIFSHSYEKVKRMSELYKKLEPVTPLRYLNGTML